jgi:hypothetical protein
MARSAIVVAIGWLATTNLAIAQPTVLSVNNQWVAPDETIRVTVSAAPHSTFGVIASGVGSGGVFAGVPLEVGADYVIIASGVLDATGRTTISYTPRFTTDGPERLYLQAGSFASAMLSLSSGIVLSNRIARSRSIPPAGVPFVEDSGTPRARIGIAALNRGRWYVQIPHEDRVFAVPVNASGPIPWEAASPVAYFVDTGCVGMAVAPYGHVWGGIGRVIGTTVYIQVGDRLPARFRVLSELYATGYCLNKPNIITELDEAMPVVTFEFPVFTAPLKLIVPTHETR